LHPQFLNENKFKDSQINIFSHSERGQAKAKVTVKNFNKETDIAFNINYFNAKVIKAFQHFCHGYYILLENLFKYLKNKINELILDPIFLKYLEHVVYCTFDFSI
jgi:hypothetical protein